LLLVTRSDGTTLHSDGACNIKIKWDGVWAGQAAYVKQLHSCGALQRHKSASGMHQCCIQPVTAAAEDKSTALVLKKTLTTRMQPKMLGMLTAAGC
jgi:hypothetical protein